jgi:RNA polymerase sigma factor (sigma-70 family)
MESRLGTRQGTGRSARDPGRSTEGQCRDLAARGANSCPSASIGLVAVTNGLGSDRDLTRGLIKEIARGQLGAKLRSQVAAWHPQASRDEVDEAFQEACLRAEGRCYGQTEGEVFSWLRTTTHRELGQMKRRTRREVLVDINSPEFQVADIADASPEQLLLDREAEAEVERITHAVLARLSERQRQVIALHSHGRQRAEIATHLGMTPRSVKRAIERIMAEGRDELVRLAGRGCESGEPLVARLAFGLASARERRQAQLHLAGCPTCGAMFERLDCWREKVAAFLPVPIAEQAHPGGVERVIHGAADALANVKQRASDGVTAARDQIADGTAHAKQHATATYYRAVDPTPLAGVRPGAAAAALASCLAIGGGATYCVEQGIDPTRPLSALVASEPREKAPKARKASVTSTASPTVTPTPTPVMTPQPTPTPQPTSTPQPTPAPAAAQQPEPRPDPPPAPADEYEPVSPAPAVTQASSTRSKPAPAPAGGPGEFDGP